MTWDADSVNALTEMPVRPTRWRAWGEIEDLFIGQTDPAWEEDRDLVDHEIRDPWKVR